MSRFRHLSSLKMTALVCRWLAVAHNSHHAAKPVIFQLAESSSGSPPVLDSGFFCPLLPLSKIMFQTPYCFMMKTWIADKVKAVKQNKQLWSSFSNIVMLAWVFGSHKAFFIIIIIIISNLNRFRGAEAQWVQFSTSFIQTNTLSEQTLLSAFSKRKV